MNGKITYHQQVSYCGKPRCRKCREGVGHGPYWYAYQTVNGQTTRTYVGKTLPPEVQAELDAGAATTIEAIGLADLSNALIRVSTLGQFRLERRNGQMWQTVMEASWQQQQRVRALLAFLLCSPERKASRTQLMAALWPRRDQETATENLSKIVYRLRKVLGHPQEMLLRSEGDCLVLAGQHKVWVDADAFEMLLTREQSPRGESVLNEALALYGGDFLPEGRQVEWVLARRQALRRLWIGLLLETADLHLAQGAVSTAIDVLDRLLANDPTNESAVRRLMTVLARLKRRGEALRAYHRLTEVLQREYGSVPSEETRALYEAVRQGGDTLPGPAFVATNIPTDASFSRTQAPNEPLAPTDGSIASGAAIQMEPIGRSHQNPLIGRTHELETLRSMLLETEQSTQLHLVGQRRSLGIPLDTQRRPQCMILMGESGIGKTRLAEEITREAQTRHWTAVWSRVYVQERGIPYRLWTEVLRKVLTIGAGLVPTLRSPAQETLPIQPLTALLPELNEIFPKSLGAHAPTRFMPEHEQLRLWEATRDLLTTISETTPLLIVLDDIQWADASSCELLGYLARHLYGYPIVLIGTCRETELSVRPPHPLRTLIAHMQRERAVVTLNIEPLTSEQIAQLVASMSNVSETMVQHIQTHAAGNPFFAEELARSSPPTLPKTVAAALDHRMGRLSAPCRQLLGNAAVLGGSFEFPLIYAMESGSAPTDEDTVLGLLEEALQSGVLTEEGAGTRVTYHFWHPLLVSHLYERVSAIRRARLHQRVAEILMRTHRGREEEVAATITHHLVNAGAEPAQIIPYAEMAGDQAYALSAYAAAEYYYRLVIEQIKQPATADESAHLAYLLERLAECSLVSGNFEEARRLFERVLELRASLSDVPSQYEAQIQALLLGEIGLTWRYTGDNQRAQQCCEQGEQVLRAANVVGGRAWARLRYLQSNLYWQEGNYELALQAAQEALALFTKEQSEGAARSRATPAARITRIQRTLEGDPVDLGRVHRMLGALTNAVGQRSTALAHLNTALALYEQYDHKREIAHVSNNLGFICLKKAEYEKAQAALRRSLNLAEQLGDAPLTSLVFSNLGELAASFDELEEAVGWYKKGLALAERFNDREYVSLWNSALAIVLMLQDEAKLDDTEKSKLDEAAQCVLRALSIGRAMRNNPCIGVALVSLGRIRIAQAQAQPLPVMRARLLMHARKDIERALALTGLEVETRTRGHLALGHISLLLGETGRARNELNQVIKEAQRYELALVETRARRLLTAPGG